MKSIILILLVCTAALGQDTSNRSELQKRSSTSYATSIVHTDEKNKDNQASSSVQVDFHTGDTQKIHYPASQQQEQLTHQQFTQAYNQPDFSREPHAESQATQQSSESLYQKQTDQDIHSYIQGFQKQQQQIQEQNQAHYQQILSPNNNNNKNQGYVGSLGSLATKQYLSINPLQLQTQSTQASNPKTVFVQKQPRTQQLYNVGYSINIENTAGPKLSYRVPNPQRNAHSYRQQKLLNGDVITGTHKDKVEKPSGFSSNQNYEQSATNIHPSNYISIDHGKYNAPNFGEKQQLTKVYSDVRNTHGYTWKSISPNVEISGYHSLEQDKPAAPHTFDHAAALGRTQSFDISNVVENGNKPYEHLAKPETTSYDVNKGLAEASSHITPDIGDVSHSEGVDIKFDTQQQQPQQNFDFESYKTDNIPNFDFGSLKGQGLELYNFGAKGPFQHNLIPSGGNIQVDKSLLESFYKNYNPIFYQPEVTLPSPEIPKSVHLKLHQSGSHPVPAYNLKYQYPNPPNGPHLQQYQPTQNVPDSQLMVNQHYAFVQAEGLKPQALSQTQLQSQSLSHSLNALSPLPSDTKPVQEQQEDSQVQQSNQQATYFKPEIQKELLRGKYLNNEHKKYMPQPQTPIPSMPQSPQSPQRYARPITIYSNEKNNFKLKTGLRPPSSPMYIVRKNY